MSQTLEYENPSRPRSSSLRNRLVVVSFYAIGLIASAPLADGLAVARFAQANDRGWNDASIKGLAVYVAVMTPIVVIATIRCRRVQSMLWALAAFLVGLAAACAQLYWADLWY